MPKNVDLTARVTGKAPTPPRKPAPFKTPAPAQAVAKALPLRQGQALAGSGGPLLTEFERATLSQIGWRPGQPIPPNVAEQVAAIRAETDAEPLASPVPEGTTIEPLESVDISQMEPGARAEVLRKLGEVQRLHRPAATADEDVTIASQAIPGMRPITPPIMPNPAAFPQAPATPPPIKRPPQLDPEIEVDVAPASPPAQVPEAQAALPAEEDEPDMESGADQMVHDCPHCGWDLTKPDIPDPTYADKQAFLQSILGQRPFIKQYSLFGGTLKIVFRTLTTKELDTIYAQVLQESRAGEIPSTMDYWEKINRYRLYLQIQRLEVAGGIVELPEGFTRETNPHAGSHWQLPKSEDPKFTGLTLVDAYINKEVLQTETMQRCVQNTCGQFNRLVSKLEALMDNSDFWRKTEEQS